MPVQQTACNTAHKPLHLTNLIDDVHKVWWDTPVSQLSRNGNKIPQSDKLKLVQKWSDESNISVEEINEISEQLITCLTWLAKFRNRGQIYSGVQKIYYKLKYRRMAVQLLDLLYRNNRLNIALKAA